MRPNWRILTVNEAKLTHFDCKWGQMQPNSLKMRPNAANSLKWGQYGKSKAKYGKSKAKYGKSKAKYSQIQSNTVKTVKFWQFLTILTIFNNFWFWEKLSLLNHRTNIKLFTFLRQKWHLKSHCFRHTSILLGNRDISLIRPRKWPWPTIWIVTLCRVSGPKRHSVSQCLNIKTFPQNCHFLTKTPSNLKDQSCRFRSLFVS